MNDCDTGNPIIKGIYMLVIKYIFVTIWFNFIEMMTLYMIQTNHFPYNILGIYINYIKHHEHYHHHPPS